MCCAPTHIAVAAFYFSTHYADLAIVRELPMPPLVKAPTGFDAPLSTNLNVDNSAKDRSLEQVICGANGFDGEDKGLDYIVYYKGRRMRLIPLSLVCLDVVLRPERAAARDGDGSSRGRGAVAYPPTPLE
jgi:hypothetical protein